MKSELLNNIFGTILLGAVMILFYNAFWMVLGILALKM